MTTQQHRRSSVNCYERTAASFLFAATLMAPIAVNAQSMVEYTTTTPLVSNSTVPNVLLVLDSSGSMNAIAVFDPPKPFSPSANFSGYFDPTKCYQYDGINQIFLTTTTANKAGGVCTIDPNYEWDGSLLNYVSMRRRDITKWVLTGGRCEGGRAADGTCPTKILRHTDDTDFHKETVQINGADAAGRMPASFTGVPVVYFSRIGTISDLVGVFCVNDYPTVLAGPHVNGVLTYISYSGVVSNCTETHNDPNFPNPANPNYPNAGFRVRVQSLTEPTGVIQQVGTRVRLGLMFYNQEQGGHVAIDIGKNLSNPSDPTSGLTPFLKAIEDNNGPNWTPLAETLYEAVRYFAQLDPSPLYNLNAANTDTVGPDFVAAPGTAADPYFFAPPWAAAPGLSVPCCKSYVIILTDGEPTHDQTIPAQIQNVPGAPPPFNIGIDEVGNTNIPDYLASVAFWAHTTDLRQATVPVIGETGNDLPGKQSLTIFTAFMFGAGSGILSETAKYGGFDTTNGNNPDATSQDCTKPDGTIVTNGSSPLWDKLNNATGLAGPDCIPDNYFESSNAATIRDNLQRVFNITESQAGSASSASVLGSSSSGEGAFYQAYFVPDYVPTTDETNAGMKEIRWLGYTQSLFVDVFGHLREDTNGDGKLTYKEDHIIVPYFDTTVTPNRIRVNVYFDQNGDGMAGDPLIPGSEAVQATIELSEIKPIWEAGRRLALTDPNNRKIFTWVATNNNGNANITFPSAFISFDQTNSLTLAPYLRAGAAPFTAANIIDFVRGKQIAGLRDRQKVVDGNLQVWKLGDIVHSSPVVVAAPNQRYDVVYGDTSYSDYYIRYNDRRQVVYAGANDGMLHAFNGGFYTAGDDPSTATVTEHGRFDTTAPTSVSAKYSATNTSPLGAELWGFIPYQLLPQLQWLMRQDYTHVDYVDLTPRVTDARIFCYSGGPTTCWPGQGSTDHPNGWGTILIGGMRFGGSCGNCETVTGGKAMTITNFNGTGQTRTFYSAYFVLDITNPEKDPVLLWSFSDADLGLTSALPTVVRVNPADQPTTDNAFARWFMAVGSGVTTYTGTSTQAGKIFVIDLATGLLEGAPFSTGDSKASMGDAISVDINLDFRVDVIYLGSSIDNGPGTPQFKGKLYRLTMAACSTQPCKTTNWGVAGAFSPRIPTVLLATFPPGNTPVGPVTAAPSVSIDTNDAFWVYWGTGRFYTNADATNTDTQYFFGVKDAVVTGGCIQTSAGNCAMNNLVNTSNAVVSTGGAVTGVTTPAGVPITSFDALKDLFGDPALNVNGWYIILPGLPAQSGKPPLLGERTLSRPTILGGTLFFTTFTPSGDFCDSAGHGRLYTLFLTTGSAFKASSLGTDPTVGGNKRFQDLGQGLPSQAALQMSARGSGTEGTMGTTTGCGSGVTAYVQANSATQTVCAKLALRSWSAIISWRDL
jgi:type IV pilus assembly protein PilY1